HRRNSIRGTDTATARGQRYKFTTPGSFRDTPEAEAARFRPRGGGGETAGSASAGWGKETRTARGEGGRAT
ncbi:MAG: hypothetical protein ACKOJF_30985, partial [Planctomycetaceae bacterium]